MSIYLLLLIITLAMINSLEYNLILELLRKNSPSLGTVGLLRAASLCWAHGAQLMHMERDKEEDERWQAPQSY